MRIITSLLLLLLSLTALAASFRLRSEDEAELEEIVKMTSNGLTEEEEEEDAGEVLAPARIPVKPIVRGVIRLGKKYGPRVWNYAKKGVRAGVRKAKEVGGKIVRGVKKAGKAEIVKMTSNGLTEEEEAGEVLAPARIPVKPIVRGAVEIVKKYGPRVVNHAKQGVRAGVRKVKEVGGKIVRGVKKADKAVWERLSIPLDWSSDDDED
ncbi:unnamed protein product [Schistocephalus solidus]|uniref:Uncharacterized protein n=1 Tax=Schistocephalus solidus TaxID=70667 RepID=A0A183TQ33_SCHSO|nr:unnamed protein product [Schistocephalus solidus]